MNHVVYGDVVLRCSASVALLRRLSGADRWLTRRSSIVCRLYLARGDLDFRDYQRFFVSSKFSNAVNFYFDGKHANFVPVETEFSPPTAERFLGFMQDAHSFSCFSGEVYLLTWSVRGLLVKRSPTMTSVMLLFCPMCDQAGEDLHVWGTGSPLRQFIYNVDLGALMVSA